MVNLPAGDYGEIADWREVGPGLRRKIGLIGTGILLFAMFFVGGRVQAAWPGEIKIEPPEEAESVSEEEIQRVLNGMTLEEKVNQLFFITPEALTGSGQVTAAGKLTAQCFAAHPVGGLVYFEQNIQTREQTESMLAGMQRISQGKLGIPVFLAVDEEGGIVTRISNRVEGVPSIQDMASVGATGNKENAYVIGAKIGQYLSELHFNVDLAPVADVCDAYGGSMIGSRSFGSDPDLTAKMVQTEVDGLHSYQIKATLKHFPGHGSASGDSHYGAAVCYKTMDELRTCDLLPFQAGIDSGADFVMAGHISLPSILEDSTPASLSQTMITQVLRREMGFTGVVLTDALNMGAVTQLYSSREAAVKALQAGVDMLLMPASFQDAYDGVLSAVKGGTISEERLDESIRRILRVKLSM